LEAVVHKYNGKVKVAKVDLDKNPSVQERLSVRSIPTVVGFANGIAVNKFVGNVSDSDLDKFVNELISLKENPK